jgi:hypothetical protein
MRIAAQRTSSHRLGALLLSLLCSTQLVGSDAQAQSLPQPETEHTQPAHTTCQPLLEQLRWHQPFFGTREWREVAQETLSYAQPQCRAQLSQREQPEVTQALRTLYAWSQQEQTPLRRYVFRVTCQLRVQSLYDLILEGTREPGVFVDCVDAVFAIQNTDKESESLRQRYLDGLAKEPLTTPIPPSLQQPLFQKQMAPVLQAYDNARRPKRDSLFAALCPRSTQSENAQAEVCQRKAEREPDWAREALLQGQVSAALPYLATMSGAHLPEFLPLLHRYDAQHIAGRDKLHRILCQQRVLADKALVPACLSLQAEAEPRWLHQQKTEELHKARLAYYYTAMAIGLSLGFLSLLLVGRAMLINRRRALAELSALSLAMDHAVQ